MAIFIFAIMDIVFVFVGGIASDRYGRRSLILIANAIALIIFYPSIYLVSPVEFTVIIAIFGVAHGLSYSPLVAFISEVFPTNMRYSGNSISYQFGNAFIVGPAPCPSDLLGTLLYSLYPLFTPVFIIIAFATVISMKETKNRSLEVPSAEA